jgi:hypothetical protein
MILLSILVAFILALYYPQTCVPAPPAARPAQIEEPHSGPAPNSDCATGLEDWSEYEVSCNNRLDRMI